jgi:hypothetical protein
MQAKKRSISNIKPFVLVKFTSSSSLVFSFTHSYTLNMTYVVKNLQQLLMNIVKGEKLERTQDLMWFDNVFIST